MGGSRSSLNERLSGSQRLSESSVPAFDLGVHRDWRASRDQLPVDSLRRPAGAEDVLAGQRMAQRRQDVPSQVMVWMPDHGRQPQARAAVEQETLVR